MSGKERLVVIGNGMAGAKFVEEVVRRGGCDRFDIVVFGDEPHGNYNRILLSGVLSGVQRPQDIFLNPLSWYARNGVTLRAGVRAERIVLESRTVYDANDGIEPYGRLVLATGSTPFVPPIRGIRSESGELTEGAFVFRTLDDCQRIAACARQVRRAVVVGGGLLGLEAARGLLSLGLEVCVVHLMSHLMETQIDEGAGSILLRRLEEMGLQIRLQTSTAAVLGDGRVEGIAFDDGSALSCELLILAAGIRPNVALASNAGLEVQRGIVVGDDLACPGVSDVYAIGECAEHRASCTGSLRRSGNKLSAWPNESCRARRMRSTQVLARRPN